MTHARTLPDFSHLPPARAEAVVIVPSDPVLTALDAHIEAWTVERLGRWTASAVPVAGSEVSVSPRPS